MLNDYLFYLINLIHVLYVYIYEKRLGGQSKLKVYPMVRKSDNSCVIVILKVSPFLAA